MKHWVKNQQIKNLKKRNCQILILFFQKKLIFKKTLIVWLINSWIWIKNKKDTVSDWVQITFRTRNEKLEKAITEKCPPNSMKILDDLYKEKWKKKKKTQFYNY